MMISGMNPIETGADVKHAWVAALSEEQIDVSMHTTLWEHELTKYDNDDDVMKTIGKDKTERSICGGS